MNSALRKIKEALGPDALILSSRTVRKGGMGLFGKPVLEVTAAVDNGETSVRTPAAELALPVKKPVKPAKKKGFRLRRAEVDDDLTYEQIWRHRPVIESYEEPPVALPAARVEATVPSPDVDQLRNELGELKKMVGDLVQDLPQRLEQLSRPRIALPVQASRLVSAGAQIDPALQPALTLLSRAGIEEETASTIAHYVASQLSARQMADGLKLQHSLSSTIADLVQTHGSIFPQPEQQKRIALIGPTGVGKTTTIAKLAAAYLLAGGKRVALVTIDTYRIAAVEQLKVYGEIMNVPVEVVMTPAQLRDVLKRHHNKDLILIDTAGRSPKDDVSLQELASFLAVDESIETHLVLSATTREKDLYEIFGRFSSLSPRSLLMTKLDECEALGVLLNIHVRNNCPLSYLANGQKVPEDLVEATPQQVSELILGSCEG
ncbi:MAG: flagellar biosynthesis protein FlhF [Desulfuromonadaceae bacterium]|nr:flagellar biosynthesis protein FlhF [Desulfuromonadaceae bacterium]